MTDQVRYDPVEELQAAGRLLLRHVTRRFDKTLAGGSASELASADIGLLTASPSEILKNNEFGKLARCVDELSRRAAPANVNTIRLTCAYLNVAEDKAMGDTRVAWRAGLLKVIFSGVFLLAGIATIVAIFLLAHVDSGRRSAQQLDAVNVEIKRVFAEFGKLPKTAWTMVYLDGSLLKQVRKGSADDYYEDRFLPFCGGEKGPDPTEDVADVKNAPSTPPSSSYWSPRDGAEGLRAQMLCSEWSQTSLREKLIYLRLQEWNGKSDRLRSFFLQSSFGLPDSPPDGVKEENWHRTEIRTSAMISSLTGFVLPMLLGLIGGCAYVLRRLDRKLASFTLDENDGMHAILRVLLATMLGGLLGVVWSADQQIEVGGFALSLAATAFFVGFALEVVFSTIEALVEGVATKVRSP